MMGLRGESMNPMTFGNMTHPNKANMPYVKPLGILLSAPRR